LFRANAEPPSLSRRDAGQFGLCSNPRLDRPRSAGPRSDRRADPRHDALLGQFQRRDDQWLVVVVDGADRGHSDGISRPFLSYGRARRDRQPAAAEKRVNEPVLHVEGLSVAFDHPLGKVQAVDEVSFALMPRERFGLAGESGSGKSTLALAIMRLIKPPGHIEAGAVWLDCARIADLDAEGTRQFRLAVIALGPPVS